jgi:hypothetical protein
MTAPYFAVHFGLVILPSSPYYNSCILPYAASTAPVSRSSLQAVSRIGGGSSDPLPYRRPSAFILRNTSAYSSHLPHSLIYPFQYRLIADPMAAFTDAPYHATV